MSRLGKSWWWQWCADLLKQVFCNLEQRRKWPSIQLQTHNLPRSSPPSSSISSWSSLTLAMTQIWEIRGLPSLACDLYHLRRHHPLFSWMAPLQNTVRLRDYHDFFLMILMISFWSASLILSKRRGCYVLKCQVCNWRALDSVNIGVQKQQSLEKWALCQEHQVCRFTNYYWWVKGKESHKIP